MTVIELWNAFEDWTPFTSVEVDDINGIHEYTYHEDAIRDFGNSSVITFSYNSADDKISIDL